jgi:endoglucanase
MSIRVPLLKQICETPGVPGFEQRIRKLVLELVTPLVDEVEVDNMGNVIAIKRGSGMQPKRVMVAAHMDEIGFIIKHIDEKGFLHFHPLGGFDPKTLTAQRVIVHGREDVIGVMGSKPIHIMSPEERKKSPELKDYFIDVGLPHDEVVKVLSVGDPVSRERQLIEMGHCVNCKSIDNRVSVYILIETLQELQRHEHEDDIYAVFTVQEEVGIRGALVATHGIDPHIGIGLDTTIAFDTPGARPDEMVTELGKGVAIKIMDASAICDYRMVRFLREVADTNLITWQHELLPAGGTDTAGLQRMSTKGTIAGAISIPTRHIHQVIEMADKRDIQGAINLLTHALVAIPKYNWAF